MKKHAHWKHTKVKDPKLVSGYLYKPECTCSNCGYYSTMEKPVCPKCGAEMDEPAE